jgi:hypothetical protein
MAEEQLPDLRTREDIQTYLSRVAKEVGVALDSPEVAEVLDRRDQLAGFRGKFELPTIGQLLEEHERDASKWGEKWVWPDAIAAYSMHHIS